MKVDFSRLDRAFDPRVLVVVGDRPTGMWLNFRKNYKGKLYSVQVNPETAAAIEAAGIKNYTNIADVPEPIDLVIVAAPRSVSMQILDDCIRKNVGALHYFTAGFSETGLEEWKEAERRLTDRAKQAGMHLIGPNCMGIYSPKAGIGQNVWPYTGFSVPIGFISQSGTHATSFGQHAYMQGMDINKGVSFGNGLVLDSADFLEYFDYDPEIKVIGMYLEGVRDGKRFLKALKKVASHKPVVIWKGGRTEEGDRAIASHTASLAVSLNVWEAAVRQCGAVAVRSMEELIDAMKALLYMPPVRGVNMGIAGGAGGPSVALADAFAEAGLKVPRLSKESYDELVSFFSLVGGGYRNPIDTGNANRRDIKRIMEILERDPNIDNLALLTGSRWGLAATPETDLSLLGDMRQLTFKPIMAVVPYVTPEEMKESHSAIRKFQERGVPAFSSVERGACAIRNAFDYYQHKNDGQS